MAKFWHKSISGYYGVGTTWGIDHIKPFFKNIENVSEVLSIYMDYDKQGGPWISQNIFTRLLCHLKKKNQEL